MASPMNAPALKVARVKGDVTKPEFLHDRIAIIVLFLRRIIS